MEECPSTSKDRTPTKTGKKHKDLGSSVEEGSKSKTKRSSKSKTKRKKSEIEHSKQKCDKGRPKSKSTAHSPGTRSTRRPVY